jgi:hypothetical protein
LQRRSTPPRGASPSAPPPSPDHPLPSQPQSASRRRRLQTENNAIYLVLCGAVLGSALTIGAFICFLLYQTHFSLSIPSTTNTPPHGETSPGGHANR